MLDRRVLLVFRSERSNRNPCSAVSAP